MIHLDTKATGYEIARQMVLWGEDREKVMERLEAIGVPAEEAQQFQAEAHKERVSIIREHGRWKIWEGLGGLALGLAGLVWPWFFAKFLEGFWKVLDALSDIMIAPSKDGPVD